MTENNIATKNIYIKIRKIILIVMLITIVPLILFITLAALAIGGEPMFITTLVFIVLIVVETLVLIIIDVTRIFQSKKSVKF